MAVTASLSPYQGKLKYTLAVFFAAWALVLTLFAQPVGAATPEEAQSFIRHVADETFSVLHNQALSTAERKTELNTILNREMALDYIAKLSLGRYGNPASVPAADQAKHAEQMAEYHALFPDYIFEKLYALVLSKFNDATVDVLGSSAVGKTDILVNTRVNRPGQQPLLADWRVRADKAGQLKIIDVRAEGISLTITQRDDFSSIIGSGGLDKLIEHMRASIATPDSATGAAGN